MLSSFLSMLNVLPHLIFTKILRCYKYSHSLYMTEMKQKLSHNLPKSHHLVKRSHFIRKQWHTRKVSIASVATVTGKLSYLTFSRLLLALLSLKIIQCSLFKSKPHLPPFYFLYCAESQFRYSPWNK